MVPEWLLRNEGYTPRSDRDAFIDKSIRTFLSLLSRIRSRTGVAQRKALIDARVKLVSLFLLILFTSLSHRLLFLGLCGTVILVILSLSRGEVILDILKIALAVAGFTFVIFLPSIFWGNLVGVLMVTAKVLICVAAARFLSATTEGRALTRALGAFRIPDLFILVLDFTLRYIILLGALSLDMLYALKLRSVGKNKDKTGSLSGIAGTLFLKSRDLAEDTYAAMECRGFTGTYRASRLPGLRVGDAFVLAADVAFVCAFAFIGA
jgi:cobalt/nickel transport system permease protein